MALSSTTTKGKFRNATPAGFCQFHRVQKFSKIPKILEMKGRTYYIAKQNLKIKLDNVQRYEIDKHVSGKRYYGVP